MFRFEKEKLYYSIREVSQIIGLKEYVLRYWETQFPQTLKPKRQSGKRVYTKDDISAARRIQELLHKKGMTIRGASSVLRKNSSERKELEIAVDSLKSLRDFLIKLTQE